MPTLVTFAESRSYAIAESGLPSMKCHRWLLVNVSNRDPHELPGHHNAHAHTHEDQQIRAVTTTTPQAFVHANTCQRGAPASCHTIHCLAAYRLHRSPSTGTCTPLCETAKRARHSPRPWTARSAPGSLPQRMTSLRTGVQWTTTARPDVLAVAVLGDGRTLAQGRSRGYSLAITTSTCTDPHPRSHPHA